LIYATALDQGNIVIQGRNLTLSGSRLLSRARGIQFVGAEARQSGDVSLDATERIEIERSLVGSDVFLLSRGNGGNVRIRTGSLSVTGGSRLTAATSGNGDAGNVEIEARSQVLFSSSSARTNVGLDAIGRGGDVRISTGSLEVINGAQLVASTQGQGNAGNVIINARDRVLFRGVSADGELSSAALSSVAGTNATGNGGDVRISTGSLEVINGAQLVASTQGQGNAGNVIINARDRVSFRGISADGELRRFLTKNLPNSL
jgi:large exoprotein involved in heme utilization and adhesion